jgi:hypothetical protein
MTISPVGGKALLVHKTTGSETSHPIQLKLFKPFVRKIRRNLFNREDEILLQDVT